MDLDLEALDTPETALEVEISCLFSSLAPPYIAFRLSYMIPFPTLYIIVIEFSVNQELVNLTLHPFPTLYIIVIEFSVNRELVNLTLHMP